MIVPVMMTLMTRMFSVRKSMLSIVQPMTCGLDPVTHNEAACECACVLVLACPLSGTIILFTADHWC